MRAATERIGTIEPLRETKTIAALIMQTSFSSLILTKLLTTSTRQLRKTIVEVRLVNESQKAK